MARDQVFASGQSVRIDKQGVAEKVVDKILELVREGLLKAGDRLPAERELIEIFGVSRPSLREALRSLSVLGVIHMRHGGGAYVTDLHPRSLLAPLDFFLSLAPDNVEQAFECRRAIETALARKAAASATDADIAALDALLAAQRNVVDDPVGFRILDSEFHEKLYALGGNAVMERMAIAFYYLGLEERRKATSRTSVIRQSIVDHEQIVEALRRAEPEAAAEALARHLAYIEQTSLEAMARDD